MADTTVQLEVEGWIRDHWMPETFNLTFVRERLELTSGGLYRFDAVSPEQEIVAVISTSGSRTSGGKLAVGKITKIRSDILFLMMVESKRKLVILSETDMYEQCMKEMESGRLPREIEIHCAELPNELRQRLVIARDQASSEVRTDISP